MKSKKNIYENNNTDMVNISSKEEEILSSYYEDEEVYKTRRKNKKEQIEEEPTTITFEDEKEVTEPEVIFEDEIEDFTMVDEKNIEEEKVEEIIEEESKYETRKQKPIVEPEYLDIDDEDDYKPSKEKRKKTPYEKAKMIINITFIIIMVILSIIAIDVISVARYDKGPYFAINTKTYDDGGTKVYTGLGYKVFKYNQLQGRKDMVVGTWFMKYDIEPVSIESFDLALEFNNDETETYKKYYKKFVRINSTLLKVDEENRTITVGYIDEDGKYTLNIKCNMDESTNNIEDLEEGNEITVLGTVLKYKFKNEKKAGTLYINNCFAEQ